MSEIHGPKDPLANIGSILGDVLSPQSTVY